MLSEEEVEGKPGERSSPHENAVPVYFQGLAMLHKLAASPLPAHSCPGAMSFLSYCACHTGF